MRLAIIKNEADDEIILNDDGKFEGRPDHLVDMLNLSFPRENYGVDGRWPVRMANDAAELMHGTVTMLIKQPDMPEGTVF